MSNPDIPLPSIWEISGRCASTEKSRMWTSTLRWLCRGSVARVVLAEHCYPGKWIIFLYAFVSSKGERDKKGSKSYRILLDYSPWLNGDCFCFCNKAECSGELNVTALGCNGRLRKWQSGHSKSHNLKFYQLRRIILLFFTPKYQNIVTCGKNPLSHSDWAHLCFVDCHLYDLQI